MKEEIEFDGLRSFSKGEKKLIVNDQELSSGSYQSIYQNYLEDVMKEETMQKLKEAQEWCEEEDKSTEFMIEYMKYCANVDHDCVINYLEKYG